MILRLQLEKIDKQWGFKSHPKTPLQYFRIALIASVNV
jgi:hypothetical protein